MASQAVLQRCGSASEMLPRRYSLMGFTLLPIALLTYAAVHAVRRRQEPGGSWDRNVLTSTVRQTLHPPFEPWLSRFSMDKTFRRLLARTRCARPYKTESGESALRARTRPAGRGPLKWCVGCSSDVYVVFSCAEDDC